MRTILAVPLWILGPVLVVVVPLLAVGIQAVVRRRWPVIAAGEHNEVAGFLIAVVGVMYAVVLAFCVIVTWERFNEAKVNVEVEASELRVVLRQAGGLPPEVRAPMHDLAVSYANEVATVEWAAMHDGRRSDDAFRILNEMYSTLNRVETASGTQEVFLAATLDRLDEVSDSRIRRLDAAGEGIPDALWAAIIVGGLLTVGFALLFGAPNERLHYLMIWGFTAVVMVQIFVILVMNYPFAGSVTVSPDALEAIVVDFR
jgi:ABC-type Co2+ transport system permease subunit